jgi:hypothetical protein
MNPAVVQGKSPDLSSHPFEHLVWSWLWGTLASLAVLKDDTCVKATYSDYAYPNTDGLSRRGGWRPLALPEKRTTCVPTSSL